MGMGRGCGGVGSGDRGGDSEGRRFGGRARLAEGMERGCLLGRGVGVEWCL